MEKLPMRIVNPAKTWRLVESDEAKVIVVVVVVVVVVVPVKVVAASGDDCSCCGNDNTDDVCGGGGFGCFGSNNGPSASAITEAYATNPKAANGMSV
jgi:hypothetical protein